jgi:DNA-binding CsgD family transcriptional regulator
MIVLESVRPRQPPAPKRALVRLQVNEDDGLRALSRREIEVLTLVASGGTREVIARQLGLAPGTVANHMMRIYRAVGAHNTSHAVALAYGRGIMSAPSGLVTPSDPATSSVSRREREVLAGLALGLTSAQMAIRLSLSNGTVKTHLQRA